MRQLLLRTRFFSGVISIDTFGFFETDEENEAVLGEVQRVLAPGGRVRLKVVNGAPILAVLRETDLEERGGVVVRIWRWLSLQPARMTEKVIVTGSRSNGEYERHQCPYTSAELSRTLKRVGVTGVELFATSDCAPLRRATSKTIWSFGQRGTS